MSSKQRNATPYPRRRRRRVVTAVALVGAACASVGASSARADILPVGGGFTPPLLYSLTGSCGVLCSVSAVPATVGGNTIVQTSYQSLLGVIGSATGGETITSPPFTWSGSTPGQATLTFQRQANLGSLLGSVTPTLTVDLLNTTTGATNQLDAVTIPSNLSSLQTVTAPVDPDLIVPGDQLQLRVLEGFTDPEGVLGLATIGLDNLGLNITAGGGSSGGSGGTGGTGGSGSSGGSGGAGGPGGIGGSGSGGSGTGSTGAGHPTRAKACLVISRSTSPSKQRLVRLSTGDVTPRRPLRIVSAHRPTKNMVIRYRVGASRAKRLRDRAIVVGFPTLRARHHLTVSMAFSRPAHRTRHLRIALRAAGC
jgi:hypothetical protein